MNTNVLAAALAGFLLGGFTVSVAADLEGYEQPHGDGGHAAVSTR